MVNKFVCIKIVQYLCCMEMIGYVLSFIYVIFLSLGLFGAFDKDKDNPFINEKQLGGLWWTFGNVEWPQSVTRQVKCGSNYLHVTDKGAVPWNKFDSCPDY